MRFHHMPGRIFLVPALALTTAATLAACSSSGTAVGTASGNAVPTATDAAAVAAATAQIKADWAEFFNTSTPNDKRASLLQNGGAFATAIKALAANPLASSVSSKVDSVTLTSATTAKVKYDLTAAGQTVAAGQTGSAVYENGSWKIGDDIFCGLLKEGAALLNITVPAACSSAG
jgi:hypothetical protein